MQLNLGLEKRHRPAAARLYWEAFGGKLGRVMGPDARALAYLERIIRADHVISVTAGGELLGIAGFKSPRGGFADGDWADLRAIYDGFVSVTPLRLDRTDLAFSEKLKGVLK